MTSAPQRKRLADEAATPAPGVRYRQAEFLGGAIVNRYVIADAKARVRRVRRRKARWLNLYFVRKINEVIPRMTMAMAGLGRTMEESIGPILERLVDATAEIAAGHPKPCPLCGKPQSMHLRKDCTTDRWYMACQFHTEVHGPCSSDPRWARIYGSELWTEGWLAAADHEPCVSQNASTLHSEPYYDRFSTESELACDWRRYIIYARHRLGLTQAELARKAGIHTSYVSKIETATFHNKARELLLIRILATTESDERPEPRRGE